MPPQTRTETPLFTVEKLKAYRKEFRKAGLNVTPDDVLFRTLATVWRMDVRYTHSLLRAAIPETAESEEEIQAAFAVVAEAYNSIIAWLAAVGDPDAQDPIASVAAVYAEMRRGYPTIEFEAQQYRGTSEFLGSLMDELNIAIDELSVNEVMQKLREQLDYWTEFPMSETIGQLLGYAAMLADKETLTLDQHEVAFLDLVDVAIAMDWIRHEKQAIRASMTKRNLKDPCPCGSGRIYKKCCYL